MKISNPEAPAERLADLLPPEHILPDLTATSGPGVIYEVAARACSLGLVESETWFAGALAEREAMLSTAVEGGVAFLHARQANCERVVRPFVLLARSGGGVDFGAPDGAPTHLFFVLGLKYDRLHLKWLSRLARLLRSPNATPSLREAPCVPSLREALIALDQGSRS